MVGPPPHRRPSAWELLSLTVTHFEPRPGGDGWSTAPPPSECLGAALVDSYTLRAPPRWRWLLSLTVIHYEYEYEG